MRRILTALVITLGLASWVLAEGISIKDHTRTMDQRTLWTSVADSLDTRCFSLSQAGYGEADAALIDVNASIVCSVGNRMVGNPAGTVSFSGYGFGEQANGTSRVYVFHLDGGGVVNATAGEAVEYGLTAAYPDLKEGLCPFASVTVGTTDGSFTLGTTAFNATGVDADFEDLSALPVDALDR